MKKYHSEKDPFRDRTIIYDEHGKKVGYSEKAIFGDHVNVYDSKGNKVARQEKSFFGDHINVYDAKGKKTGEWIPPMTLTPSMNTANGKTLRLLSTSTPVIPDILLIRMISQLTTMASQSAG